MTGPDLIPDSEGASRFLPWVVAVMVFFAALAGAVGLTLHQATGTWRDDLANKIDNWFLNNPNLDKDVIRKIIIDKYNPKYQMRIFNDTIIKLSDSISKS